MSEKQPETIPFTRLGKNAMSLATVALIKGMPIRAVEREMFLQNFQACAALIAWRRGKL